jgi:ABC-type Fe3+ transport system permease subunit
MNVLFAESNLGWVIGYTVGVVVVLVVVALVVPILILAKSIGGEAKNINDRLLLAEKNTSGLSLLNATITMALAVIAGLTRGRKRLGG